MSHAELYSMRDSVEDQELQNEIAAKEHRAFARQWVQDNPVVAPASLLFAIPGYSAAKKLGLLRARTPGSLDEMAEAYRGLGEGLQSFWNK